MPQHRLHALQIRRLDQIVARTGAQRGHRAVDRGMARHNDHFRRFGFIQLAHQLDPLAIGQPQIRQEHIRTLASQLDPRVLQAQRARDREALHSSDFLQPVDDIGIVVHDQSMCHEFLIGGSQRNLA